MPHFYPRPPRGGRPAWYSLPSPTANFYPRPPRGGRRMLWPTELKRHKFLSTPSARRATLDTVAFVLPVSISIHALREEGDAIVRSCASFLPYFYPRPPRGGRHIVPSAQKRHSGFLSTPSARRATPSLCVQCTALAISIHALREEGDGIGLVNGRPVSNFYPRPPRGGRPEMMHWLKGEAQFLSTPSARRATRPA